MYILILSQFMAVPREVIVRYCDQLAQICRFSMVFPCSYHWLMDILSQSHIVSMDACAITPLNQYTKTLVLYAFAFLDACLYRLIRTLCFWWILNDLDVFWWFEFKIWMQDSQPRHGIPPIRAVPDDTLAGVPSSALWHVLRWPQLAACSLQVGACRLVLAGWYQIRQNHMCTSIDQSTAVRYSTFR